MHLFDALADKEEAEKKEKEAKKEREKRKKGRISIEIIQNVF